MSRTDKTRPYWVQMLDEDNRGWLTEHHDHRKGECDIEVARAEIVIAGKIWIESRTRCAIWPSARAAHSGIYARSSGCVRIYRKKDLGRIRGLERKMVREVLKSSKAAREDFDYPSSRHRHNALWESY